MARHDKVYQANRQGRDPCSSSPATPATPIGRVFGEGPIEILVTRVRGQQVSLGVSAHGSLFIYRGEKEGVVPWRGDSGQE